MQAPLVRSSSIAGEPTAHRRPLLPVFLILALLTTVTSLQNYLVLFTGTHSFANFLKTLCSAAAYFGYFSVLAVFVRYLVQKYPLDRYPAASTIVLHGGILLVSFCVHQAWTLAVDLLLGFKQWRTELLLYVLFNNPGIWLEALGYGLLLLVFSLMESRAASEEHELRCRELESQLVASRLRELRTRVHPGFVFHSIATMRNLVDAGKNTQANRILTDLSEFLRATVYRDDAEEETLDGALNFLRQYLAIERSRFGSRFTVHESVHSAPRGALVPSFFLQPLAEAMVESLASEQEKHLDVVARTSGPELEILLDVTGQPERAASGHRDRYESEGHILRERLGQLYDDRASFRISASERGKISACVKVPLHVLEANSAHATFSVERLV